jgi:hypothetical protein
VRKKYQRKERKSNHKFEVVGGQELLVRVPLPLAEVWAEMQAQVEELTGYAGLQILRAILENEVTRRVGPPHRPNPTAGCVRWGKQPGIRSDNGGAGYNPEPEGSWISSKLWKTGPQLSGSNSTKFSARFKRWLEVRLRSERAGSTITARRPSGSPGRRNRKFGLRGASGSDAPVSLTFDAGCPCRFWLDVFGP